MNFFKISKSFYVLIFFITLLTFSTTTYAVSYDWVEPENDPPTGNIPPPINQGSSAQYKTGPLTLTGGELTTPPSGTLLKVVGNSLFNGNISVSPSSASSFSIQNSTVNLLVGAQIVGTRGGGNTVDSPFIDLSTSLTSATGKLFSVQTKTGTGIYAKTDNAGWAIFAEATSDSAIGNGVYGNSTLGNSIYGRTTRGNGIWGEVIGADANALAGRFDGKVQVSNGSATTTITGGTIKSTTLANSVTGGACLFADGTGVITASATACGSGTGGTNYWTLTTSNNYIYNNNTGSRVGIGNTDPKELLSVGSIGKKGTIGLYGENSGKVVIQTASAAGNWTLTLPTATGTAGQFLKTDGAGVTSWANAGSASQTPWGQNINADGYTLYGDNSDNGNLTLDSTSSSTKGYTLINPTGGNVGIGTTTPASALHVLSASAPQFTLSRNSTTTTSFTVESNHDLKIDASYIGKVRIGDDLVIESKKLIMGSTDFIWCNGVCPAN